MKTFAYSDRGFALTKGFEGLRLEAYRDVAGVWTIGYGHTGSGVTAGLVWTQEQAEAALAADLGWAVMCVNQHVSADLTQNQFDALVDFCFNVGPGAWLNSTLLRQVNLGNFERAAAQFLLWVKAGGQKVEGLVRRRQAERELFLSVQ